MGPTAVLQGAQAGRDDCSYTYGADAALVKASAGNYYLDVEATAAGLWACQILLTGAWTGSRRECFSGTCIQFLAGG